MSKLIILRGNSGSGKSSTALRLQHELGYGTMLIPQDVVRREILRVKGDAPGNPTVDLLSQMALYGKSVDYTVIVEGILQNSTNQQMLLNLLRQFDETYVYYFDISFEETQRRHTSKPNAGEFGTEDMRRWWRHKDYLSVEGETYITDDMSEQTILELILADVSKE